MRPINFKRAALVSFAVAIVGASGMAVAQTTTTRTPAQAIEYRHDQFRRLGRAFKGVNDQARAGSPDLAVIRTNSQTISQLAADFPTWFPAGSGSAAGETDALPAVWSNRTVFDTKVRDFQTAAQNLATAAAGTNTAAIQQSARALGATCSSCHHDFRAD